MGLRILSAAGAGTLILLNFRPMSDTIAFGQIDLALLLMLTLALWALHSGSAICWRARWWRSARCSRSTRCCCWRSSLSSGAGGRWPGFALGMLVLNGLSIAVIGWEMHRVYLFEVLPRIGGTTSWVENQTISGFLARLVALPTDTTIFHNRPLELLGLALGGAVGLLACLLALRPARSTSTSFALQYGSFALVMVLTVPAAWMHYETLLFLPVRGAAAARARSQDWPYRAALLAIGFALAGYGNQWSYYDGTVLGVLTVLGVSYKFYGMLLLAGVLATTLLEEWAPSWRDVVQFIPWRHDLPGSVPSA